jgi:hypothetical protein
MNLHYCHACGKQTRFLWRLCRNSPVLLCRCHALAVGILVTYASRPGRRGVLPVRRNAVAEMLPCGHPAACQGQWGCGWCLDTLRLTALVARKNAALAVFADPKTWQLLSGRGEVPWDPQAFAEEEMEATEAKDV